MKIDLVDSIKILFIIRIYHSTRFEYCTARKNCRNLFRQVLRYKLKMSCVCVYCEDIAYTINHRLESKKAHGKIHVDFEYDL